jgi:hypothetical protein
VTSSRWSPSTPRFVQRLMRWRAGEARDGESRECREALPVGLGRKFGADQPESAGGPIVGTFNSTAVNAERDDHDGAYAWVDTQLETRRRHATVHIAMQPARHRPMHQ